MIKIKDFLKFADGHGIQITDKRLLEEYLGRNFSIYPNSMIVSWADIDKLSQESEDEINQELSEGDSND